MSTPQTLPPHHPNYGFPHHQNYQSSSGYRANSSLLNGGSRLGAYNLPNTSTHGSSSTSAALPDTPRTHPHDTQAAMPTQRSAGATATSSSTSTTMAKKRQRSRDRGEPDWDTFYKNGLPKEIIVIDDSPEPPTLPNPQSQNGRSHTGTDNGHAAKKRKRDDVGTAYDPVYHLDPTNDHTPEYNSTSKSTISTDRTTSALHTTAATSLGSHSSNGQNGYDDAEVHLGQKRKRNNTRLQANEAKKRELEVNGDAFASYKPPPFPPIKAPEVAVKQIADVGCLSWSMPSISNKQQTSYTKNSKVDDDDGHYIVVPDSDLTERCMLQTLPKLT